MSIIDSSNSEELKKAIEDSVNSFLKNPENNKKKSLYKSYINDLINKSFTMCINGVNELSSSSINMVKSNFSGRGKAWVKVSQVKDKVLWERLNNLLRNSELLKQECNDYMDKFELLDFAYIRYYSVNAYNCKFEVRVLGSLKASKIKLITSHDEALSLDFLEGTPISTELEITSAINKKNIDNKIQHNELTNINEMFQDKV